ncbi:MAG: hypothetical protein IT176_05375 [Acidobacteria bacterium]|nr:hypothetical protein [Acidobacteriota bacterium]
MSDVAIIGADDLGGAIAHLLAGRNLVRAIRLADDRGRVAAGKALDIVQAGAIEAHATRIDASADPLEVTGARIVVVAGGAGRGEWQGDEGLRLIRAVLQRTANPIVLCAGASHRELVERGCRELRVPRARLIGSAPHALTAAARALVALETDSSPRDVGLTLLGVPPGGIVIPWTDATIGGFNAVRVVGEPQRRRIASRLPALWPPGAYALAAAAVDAVAALVGRSRATLSCFVGPDLASGARTRAAALPVRLGLEGIERVAVPELSALERVALENAMNL